jgi:phasin family protein
VTTKTTQPKTRAATPAAKVAAPVMAPPKAVAKPAKPAPVATVATPVVAEWPVAEQPAAPAVETPAVETKIIETPAVVAVEAPAKSKEFKMNDTIKDAAEKGQAYLADITAKAKTAAEKGTKAVEELTEFGKGNVEALVESGKIAAKGLETLGQGYAEYTRKSFENTTAAFKSFAGVKSPTDFFKLHSEFVKGQFDSIVAETSKNTEALIKLAGEVAQPISSRVAVAAEKLKIAA